MEILVSERSPPSSEFFFAPVVSGLIVLLLALVQGRSMVHAAITAISLLRGAHRGLVARPRPPRPWRARF